MKVPPAHVEDFNTAIRSSVTLASQELYALFKSQEPERKPSEAAAQKSPEEVAAVLNQKPSEREVAQTTSEKLSKTLPPISPQSQLLGTRAAQRASEQAAQERRASSMPAPRQRSLPRHN